MVYVCVTRQIESEIGVACYEYLDARHPEKFQDYGNGARQRQTAKVSFLRLDDADDGGDDVWSSLTLMTLLLYPSTPAVTCDGPTLTAAKPIFTITRLDVEYFAALLFLLVL